MSGRVSTCAVVTEQASVHAEVGEGDGGDVKVGEGGQAGGVRQWVRVVSKCVCHRFISHANSE